MDKLAAEKIASEYYALGQKVAQDKLASQFIKGMHGALATLAGAKMVMPAAEMSNAALRRLMPEPFLKLDALEAAKAAKAALGPNPSALTKGLLEFAEQEAGLLPQIAGAAPLALGALGGVGAGVGLYKGLNRISRIR